MSKITDLLYEEASEEFLAMDGTFYAWDKGDCSEVGALLCLLKYKLKTHLTEPYYLDSYPEHEELFNTLFKDATRFIS